MTDLQLFAVKIIENNFLMMRFCFV